jgi:hypothetical protein
MIGTNKYVTETADFTIDRGMVGEHSCQRRRQIVRLAGAAGSDYAGISNDNASGKLAHRKSKVS